MRQARAAANSRSAAAFASSVGCIAGSSLGGLVALQLKARGRAWSVVAFAPAGGWARGDESYKETLALQATMVEAARTAAPHADALLATADGRRRATQYMATRFEHIPRELLAHQLLGVAGCAAALPLIDHALRRLEPPRGANHVPGADRLGGTDDKLLPWPSAAARYRSRLAAARGLGGTGGSATARSSTCRSRRRS